MTTSPRALLVLTSHGDLGGLRPTGYYISEAAEPWEILTRAGWEVHITSIAGGQPPEDGRNDADPIQRAFLNDPHVAEQLRSTTALKDIDPSMYRIVFFVGGHGTMWDFPTSTAVQSVGRAVYEAGGVLAAVCHGPSALVGMTLSDGSSLISGRRVTGFTNEEEKAVGLTEVVPFLLADAMESKGATHVPASSFTENVVVDGRIVTGQNPQSAAATAQAAVAAAALSA